MSVENFNDLAKRAQAICEKLKELYPDAVCQLKASTPWQLLVATVLSAQCTDERVNKITPPLFARWPDAKSLALAKVTDLEEMIRSAGFFRNKAKNLLAAAERLVQVYGGELPHTLAELMTLPGVARKTANVVLFGAFGLNEGLAVDTHVKRIAYRLGLTTSTNPLQVEKDLLPLFPKEEWGRTNHRLVLFGREVCKARNPKCLACKLAKLCPQNKPPS